MTLVRFVAVLFAISFQWVTAAVAAEKVVVAELNWTGAKAISYVIKAVIENELGGQVEIKQADPAVIFAAMDKGDGGIDVYSDLWIPSQAALWKEYIDKRKTVLSNTTPYKGIQRMWVPGYFQDKYNVKHIEDLKRPEIVKLLDAEGKGKGQFWAGGPGWNSTNTMIAKFKSLGLDALYEHYVVDQLIFLNKLAVEYKRQGPILFYMYTPEWAHIAYDLRPLEEAPFTGYSSELMKENPLYNPSGCFKMYFPKDRQDWLEASHAPCQAPDAEVWVAYTKNLNERAPKTAAFLKNIKFTVEMLNGWLLEIGRDKKDAQDVAETWVKANKPIVAEWLRDVKK